MKVIFSPKLIDSILKNQEETLRFDHILDFLLHCVIEPSVDSFQKCSSFDFLKLCNFQDNMVNFNISRAILLNKYRSLLSSTTIQAKGKSYTSIYEEYIDCQKDMFILFVGKDELKLEGQVLKNRDDVIIDCVQLFNPYTCEYGLLNGIINEESVNNELFANQLCEHTNEYFEPYRKLKDSERNEHDFRFGKMVADRHIFVYSKELSRINTLHSKGRRRDVYVKYFKGKPIYYISVDTEHGALEAFAHHSKSPKHLGEYNFSCNKTKNADAKNHKLYLKK